MRIIRGTHKGRKITAPSNLPVRPTTDMAKEGLFNILDNHLYFEDLRVLDLYAGTGNISYEFASRGSRPVIAVDLNPHCIRFISETASKLGFEQLKSVRSSSIGFLGSCRERFDLIFADPPFDLGGTEEVVSLVFERELLVEGGWLIIEHDRSRDFSSNPNFTRLRNYGKVNFSFFRK